MYKLILTVIFCHKNRKVTLYQSGTREDVQAEELPLVIIDDVNYEIA